MRTVTQHDVGQISLETVRLAVWIPPSTFTDHKQLKPHQ